MRERVRERKLKAWYACDSWPDPLTSVSLGFADFFQVDMLSARYKIVNFEAEAAEPQ